MQLLPTVGRKLTMLATVVLLPGGLVALCAIALVIVMARTERGRRALLAVKPRLPMRVKAPLKRVIKLVDVEKMFLIGTPALP